MVNNMVNLRSKIRGMFLGVAIGDAFGLPVEGWQPERIVKKHDRIVDYVSFNGNRKHLPKGSTSDDSQLTIALAKGLINGHGFDMHAISKAHIEAFKMSTAGWGRGTRTACERLSNGESWDNSALRDVEGGGSGNGVSMKIAPLAAYSYLIHHTRMSNFVYLSLMTHFTKLAAQSAIMQAWAIKYCLGTTPKEFANDSFIRYIRAGMLKMENQWKKILAKHLLPEPSFDPQFDLYMQLDQLSLSQTFSWFEARQRFGNGNCFVYNSLPFSHFFFLRNPFCFASVECVVNSGGDTDTNGSQVGALLGALNGENIFPKKLKKQVQNIDEIEETADAFYQAFV